MAPDAATEAGTTDGRPPPPTENEGKAQAAKDQGTNAHAPEEAKELFGVVWEGSKEGRKNAVATFHEYARKTDKHFRVEAKESGSRKVTFICTDLGCQAKVILRMAGNEWRWNADKSNLKHSESCTGCAKALKRGPSGSAGAGTSSAAMPAAAVAAPPGAAAAPSGAGSGANTSAVPNSQRVQSEDGVCVAEITGDAALNCHAWRNKLNEAPNKPGKSGAVSTFEGLTRDDFVGAGGERKKVTRLEYEAYAPMAAKQMLKVCEEARAKWPNVSKVVAAHRTGHVPSGKPSVFIGVASPHRRDCMDAVAFLIDKVKEEVPIWKKERYADGSASWKEAQECKADGKRWAGANFTMADEPAQKKARVENKGVPKKVAPRLGEA